MEIMSDENREQLNKVVKVEPSAQLSKDQVRIEGYVCEISILKNLIFLTQISHKLLLRAFASLKGGVKSSTAEYKATERREGMREALEELAAFCDRELRLKEDESEIISGVQLIFS